MFVILSHLVVMNESETDLKTNKRAFITYLQVDSTWDGIEPNFKIENL